MKVLSTQTIESSIEILAALRAAGNEVRQLETFKLGQPSLQVSVNVVQLGEMMQILQGKKGNDGGRAGDDASPASKEPERL